MPDIMWQKRQALQIAAQLPDGLDDAKAILKFAGEFIDQAHSGALEIAPVLTSGVKGKEAH